MTTTLRSALTALAATYTGRRSSVTATSQRDGRRGHRRLRATLSIGLGVRAHTWVRVFTLTQPTRVVIDVGH